MEPKFHKRQLVRISVYSEGRGFKNKLAARYVSYSGQPGEIVDSRRYRLNNVDTFLYRVKMDDGKVIELTEDCFLPGE